MNWKIKALIQKVLATSRIGDKLNHFFSLKRKKYHSYTTQYQAYECIRKFKSCNISIGKEAKALEIGTGYSIISPVILSLLGFKKIITVDITNDLIFFSFKKQIQYLDLPNLVNEIVLESIYSKEEVETKIKFIQKTTSFDDLFKNLNIIYIAPYKFEEIEKECSSFDYISSQVVLEHVSPLVLDLLFYKTKKWLDSNGFIVHTINFIDHFTNPGFFQDQSISEFNFLKYSNKYWNFWAGNPIAYTNRLSYLYYLDLSKKHNLNVVKFEGQNYKKRIELDLKSIHPDIIRKYKNEIDINLLTKYQRGTLILN